MKNKLKHLELTIKGQTELLNKKDEEIQYLKKVVKQQNKVVSELWDIYLSETKEL